MRRSDPFGWRLVKFKQNKLQILSDERMTLRVRGKKYVLNRESDALDGSVLGICCERETDRGMDRYHFQSITQL